MPHWNAALLLWSEGTLPPDGAALSGGMRASLSRTQLRASD